MSKIGICGVPPLILKHLISSIVSLVQLVFVLIVKTMFLNEIENIRTNLGLQYSTLEAKLLYIVLFHGNIIKFGPKIFGLGMHVI